MKKFFSEKCRKMTKTAGCLLMAAVLAMGYLNYREVSISDLPELTSYSYYQENQDEKESSQDFYDNQEIYQNYE